MTSHLVATSIRSGAPMPAHALARIRAWARMTRGAALAGLAASALLGAPHAQAASAVDRDYVSLIGVPQVLRFAQAVSHAMAAHGSAKFPMVTAVNALTGARLFCGGISRDKPDLYLRTSATAPDGAAICAASGRPRVLALPIGRDALAVATVAGNQAFSVSRRALYLAMAQRVPAEDAVDAGSNPLAATFVPNRFTRWNQIDPSLPDRPIHLLLPPPQSVDWWAMKDMIMLDGCRAVKQVVALEKVDVSAYLSLCYYRRADHALSYAAGQDYADNPVLIPSQPDEIAIGPFQMLSRSDRLVPLPVEGVVPDPASITAGAYPLQRLVTLYIKPEKYPIVPGLQPFVIEMTGAEAAGPGGYLTKLGLIPLPDVQLREIAVQARFSQP